MIRLLDGPVEGTYAVKRGPLYLRAVIGRSGKTDVLDQPHDEPAATETIHVYRRVTEVSQVHVRMSGKSRNATGFYAMADYVHMPEVDGEPFRDREAWIAWATAQPVEVRP